MTSTALVADNYLQLTGSTPLVRLHNLLPNSNLQVYAKLEQFNPGGSAKDRTAHALVTDALADGRISGDDVHLVESSSGNLGVALARQAAARNWQFTCVVDKRVNRATVETMRALGAHIDTVKSPDPESGDWLVARRKRVAELLRELPHATNLDQYSSESAFRAHDEGTMREIVQQLGGAPDAVFVAMSTTGTVGGCARHLRRIGAPTQVFGVDAEGSVLFGGTRGTRHLPGYGAGMVPALSQSVVVEDVIRIPDAQAVVGARTLTRAEGILPGASGGAVVSALITQAQQLEGALGCDAIVVLVLHDGGAAYMDTVYNDDWVEQQLGLSPEECEKSVEAWLQ